MDLLRKYMLNSIAVFDPRERTRVAEALQDEPEGNEPQNEAEDDVEQDAEDDVEGTEDDEFADEEPEPEPERQPRARQRIERLSVRNRELQAKVDAADARLAALEARQNAPAPQPAPDPREEEARLALMTPEERLTYRFEKSITQNNQATARMLSGVQDQTDKSSFRAFLNEKPHYKKFEAEVEKRLKQLTANGNPLPREAVLTYVVGEHTLKSGEQPRRRSQSQQRVQQQETRPGSSGHGDVRSDRRQTANTSNLERRLTNVRI